MKKQNKFSLIESGLLLIILGIVLISISISTITLYIKPSIDLNKSPTQSISVNDIVSITLYDNAGLCYYICPEGYIRNEELVSQEYGRAYLSSIYDNSSATISPKYKYITIETKDRIYSNWFSSATKTESMNKVTDISNSIPIKLRGKIIELDQYQKINIQNQMVYELGYLPKETENDLIPYIIEVNYPTDEIIEFILALISITCGIIFITSHIIHKKK